jgi:hypothetical protein
VAAGLSPELGGTLKITELVDVNSNTTPEDFINSLTPSVNIASYEVVIIVLDNSKYILKLQNTVVGSGETPTTASDFILLTDSFSGTVDYVAKFTPSGSQIDDSQIYDNGTTVAIGTATPSASSLLQLDSTSKGLLQPRMTTVERDAITSPAEGLTIFNITTHKPNYYNGTVWIELQENTVSGTVNKVAKFTPNGTTVGDSNITDTGSLVTIASDTDIVGATEITGETTIIGATNITGVTTIKTPPAVPPLITYPLYPTFVLLDNASGGDPLEMRPSQGGKRNTFIGAGAGKVSTITAQNNTILGALAGNAITTGSNNTMIGYSAGGPTSTTRWNTMLGSAAGINNTAEANTFLGASAGYFNTTGQHNVFIGYNTANNNVIGNYNTAVGFSATSNIGFGGLSANYNTSLGHTPGATFREGNNNLFLGYLAGSYLNDTTSQMNTINSSIFIGAQSTGGDSDDQTNQIVIGNNARGLGSNTTVIGNSSTTVTGIFGNLRLMSGMLTPPSTSTSSGAAGTIIFDSSHIYVCTATNTWKRVAISTW